MKKVQITETVLRDANQSLMATRLPYSDFEAILPEMDNLCLLEGSCVERRVQQRVEALRVDHGDGFFFGDHALVDQIAGDLHGGGSGARVCSRA